MYKICQLQFCFDVPSNVIGKTVEFLLYKRLEMLTRKIVRKAVFCVDNVDPSLAVNDLCQFVSSMNVKVNVIQLILVVDVMRQNRRRIAKPSDFVSTILTEIVC